MYKREEALEIISEENKLREQYIASSLKTKLDSLKNKPARVLVHYGLGHQSIAEAARLGGKKHYERGVNVLTATAEIMNRKSLNKEVNDSLYASSIIEDFLVTFIRQNDLNSVQATWVARKILQKLTFSDMTAMALRLGKTKPKTDSDLVKTLNMDLQKKGVVIPTSEDAGIPAHRQKRTRKSYR